jgi:LPS export ABC transporter protein LptC
MAPSIGKFRLFMLRRMKSLHSSCYVIEFFMKKGVLACLIFVLLFSIFFMLKTGRESYVDLRVTGNSFLEDIKILQKKKGETRWILTAEKADFLEGDNKAVLQTVGLAVPENNLMLYADKGTYDFSKKSFTADTVVEARGENYRITADSLDLDVSLSGIQTEGRVNLEGKGFSVEGKGMQAGKEQKVRIFKDVKAIFQK